MSTYLPVGSIIKINDVIAVTIGFDSIQMNGEIYDGYSIVKFPVGYMGNESVAFIKADAEFEVIQNGFSTDEFKEYLQLQKELFETLRPLGQEKINEQFNNIVEAVVGKAENK